MLHRVLGVFILIFVGFLMAYKLNHLKNDGAPEGPPIELVSFERLQSEIKKGDHKVVLINLWASWCVPCRKEFPELLQIKEKYAEKGVNIIFVSADNEEDKALAVQFLKDQKVNFLSFYKGNQNYEVFDQIYPGWNGALPASLIFKPSGELVESWFGETSGAEFERRILKHL